MTSAKKLLMTAAQERPFLILIVMFHSVLVILNLLSFGLRPVPSVVVCHISTSEIRWLGAENPSPFLI